MGKSWLAFNLEKAIKGNQLGQYKLSNVLSDIYKEYDITHQINGPISLSSITRNAYWVQCKDQSRFIILYDLHIFFEEWPETIPTDYEEDEFWEFLENRVYTGIKNGSKVTFLYPAQAPLISNEGVISFQILGRHFSVSDAIVTKDHCIESKANEKADHENIMRYLNGRPIVRLDDYKSQRINRLIANHPDFNGMSPTNIYKITEDEFEFSKVPFNIKDPFNSEIPITSEEPFELPF